MAIAQSTALKVGAYLAFFTACLHMMGTLAGPPAPANDTERQLLELSTNYKFVLPGGPNRAMAEISDGLSLVFALMIALTGGLALIISRRAAGDPLLAVSAARALAGGYMVLLVISLTHFFLIPTVCIASVALAFLVASRRR